MMLLAPLQEIHLARCVIAAGYRCASMSSVGQMLWFSL